MILFQNKILKCSGATTFAFHRKGKKFTTQKFNRCLEEHIKKESFLVIQDHILFFLMEFI